MDRQAAPAPPPIKLHEDLFAQCCKAILDDYAKLAKKSARSAKDARNPALIGLLGQMEDDFGMLAAFCDSAVHIDRKPLVLIDPEEQNTFVLDLDDGLRRGNLAYIVADLVDRCLVQKALTQFDTTETVALTHLSGPHHLHHRPPDFQDGQESAVQISAYGRMEM